MRLRVRKGERLGGRRDQADETLPGAHGGEVDGLAVQAFRREQLERAVAAHDVEGADLRHHVGGDEDHDPVEAGLGADRLRHDLAEAAQEDARTAESGWHELLFPSGPAKSRRPYIVAWPKGNVAPEGLVMAV